MSIPIDFMLSILINLCLVFAVWKIRRQEKIIIREIYPKLIKDKALSGKLDKMYIRSVVSEKMAERAFNMASSANLGVIALQKALQTPRLMTKQQVLKNQLAKDDVDKLFTTAGTFDYLRPILSDEENELLDNLEREQLKNGREI